MNKKIASYPEGFAEGSLSWMQVAKRITSALADGWFGGYQAKSVRDSFSTSQLDYDPVGNVALDTALVAGNEFHLIPEFSSTLQDKGYEKVGFVMSDLGQKITDSLDALGVFYQKETKILVSDTKVAEFPEEVSARADSVWSTYFGNAFTQSFEIYKDSAGKEYCYWFAPILYGSRGFSEFDILEILSNIDDPSSIVRIELTDEEKRRGVITFGEWSTKINLPWLSKCLFYLGETPFPSSMASMSRGLAYPNLDPQDLPVPYMKLVQNHQVTFHQNSLSATADERQRTVAALAPQQIQLGWLFSADDFESHRTILTTITTALTRIISFIEDGYLNHNEPGSPFQFDAVVHSDSQLERKFADNGVHGGYSHWIPVTEVFQLFEETRQKSDALYSPLRSENAKKQDLIWIVDEGVGKNYVGSAINDAIFNHFLPQKEWGGVEWYACRAIELNVVGESTNAISNWGISKYLQGDFPAAKNLFEAALNREDKFAEDEASFYLSRIFDKEGDLVKSEEYRKRCEAAGGYEATFL